MSATINGCEMVLSKPMGSGESEYAKARSSTGTNSWRGTAFITSMTVSLKDTIPVSPEAS